MTVLGRTDSQCCSFGSFFTLAPFKYRVTIFPSLPIACHISLMHSTVKVQSFTQDWEELLGKEGSQGKMFQSFLVWSNLVLKEKLIKRKTRNLSQEVGPYWKKGLWCSIEMVNFTERMIKKEIFACWKIYNQACETRGHFIMQVILILLQERRIQRRRAL